MEYNIFQLQYALDTLLPRLWCLVMWMAAGFAMLEAGLVRSKNTVEILTKNITLLQWVHYVHGCRIQHHVRETFSSAPSRIRCR
ncbi:MAG: hypothetical protein CM15mP74_26560 [Halieaceae bacterium]|nr:MAG: hypothetical protein CM15mP74_26560 [Halieaceae bacterium]